MLRTSILVYLSSSYAKCQLDIREIFVFTRILDEDHITVTDDDDYYYYAIYSTAKT